MNSKATNGSPTTAGAAREARSLRHEVVEAAGVESAHYAENTQVTDLQRVSTTRHFPKFQNGAHGTYKHFPEFPYCLNHVLPRISNHAH